MHAVFIDFSKAFDTIDHKKLLFKLKQKNIPKTLLLLLKSYLENRTCFIHTNGIDSQCFTPMAGVPQGSCISPILFSLFVSDIPKSVICKLSQFADDIAIFNIFNNHKNRNALQDYLNQIVEHMNIIGKKNLTCKIKNIELENVTHIKFLAITLDSKGLYEEHRKNQKQVYTNH